MFYIYLHQTLLAGTFMLTFFFSVVLLCSRLLMHSGNILFSRSRKLLGYAFLIMAMLYLVQLGICFLSIPADFSYAWNISCVHFCTILVVSTFGNLMDKNFLSSHKIRRDYSCWALNTVLAWIAVFNFSGSTQLAIFLGTAVIYLLEVIRMSLNVRVTRAQTQARLENFYSEGVGYCLRWLSRNVYYMAGVGLCGVFLSYAHNLVRILYLILLVVTLSYIFITFLNYVLRYPELAQAILRIDGQNERERIIPVVPDVLKPEDAMKVLSEIPEVQEQVSATSQKQKAETLSVDHVSDKASITEKLLRENLDKWIVNGGYLSQGITLEELAAELMSNRTYLSGYINNTYNCTFKEFIYMLRIESAISIMMEEPNISIEELGNRVGIPSASTFNRQFVKQMGVTPAVWKMMNLQKNVM